MKPIFSWTLKQYKMTTFWWSISLAAYMFINLIFYPTFKNNAEQLRQSFENIPDTVLQLLGGSSDFFSPIGFLNSKVFFVMLPMLLGILAISLGSNLLASEEQSKTIEGLLSRPISRGKLLFSKALVGLVVVSTVALASLVAIVIIAKIVALDVSAIAMAQTTFVCLLLVMTFAVIAYAITATGRARGASIGITTAIALGGYIVASLADTITWLRVPSKFLPFAYYDSGAILQGTYNWLNIWYFIGVIIVCSLLAWVVFRRRDLT